MQFKASKLFALIGLGLLVAAMSMLLAFGDSKLAEARYLPTRADESDLEVLKELIRTLMAESSSQEPRMANGKLFVPSPAYYRDQFQVQRRSMEMPVASANGPEQQLLRAPSSASSSSN